MKRPLRILMISDVYFPRVNGVSTSIRTYRHDLQQMGHRCVLVALRYPAREDAARWEGRAMARRVVALYEEVILERRALPGRSPAVPAQIGRRGRAA